MGSSKRYEVSSLSSAGNSWKHLLLQKEGAAPPPAVDAPKKPGSGKDMGVGPIDEIQEEPPGSGKTGLGKTLVPGFRDNPAGKGEARPAGGPSPVGPPLPPPAPPGGGPPPSAPASSSWIPGIDNRYLMGAGLGVGGAGMGALLYHLLNNRQRRRGKEASAGGVFHRDGRRFFHELARHIAASS